MDSMRSFLHTCLGCTPPPRSRRCGALWPQPCPAAFTRPPALRDQWEAIGALQRRHGQRSVAAQGSDTGLDPWRSATSSI